MSDENKNNDLAEVAHSIGLLSGKLEVMHSSITDNFKTLRDDMRRMEDSTKQSMQLLEASTKQSMEHLENRLNSKVDSLGSRVKVLEEGEKATIKLTAKQGVTLGGLSAALTLGAVELLKHFK
jgi:hypothetical protein